MRKFAIGIPTINQAEYLIPNLISYLENDFKEIDIFLIDNGNQDFSKVEHYDRLTIVRSQTNLGVAQSWNDLCICIFKKHQWALILNDDVYSGLVSNDIHKILDKHRYAGFIQPTTTWCQFLITIDTFYHVGYFDANFYPAYFEDNDFAYRLKLDGYHVQCLPELVPQVFNNSMSVKKDPSLNLQFNVNRVRYIEKWGGEPGKETFKTPFNK